MKGFEHPETTKTWDWLYYRDPLSIRFYDQAIGRVLELLEVTPGARVLDAGCGAGVHSIRAARSGCEVHAIDYSQSALDDAASRARDAGFASRIQFSREDLRQLTFPDRSYDRVFSWGVLIHIREIEKAMDELVRILADGGRLALYVGNSGALQVRVARLKRRLGRGGSALRRLPLGYATEVEFQGETIWVWFNDVEATVRYLEERGLRLVGREAGEFSDFHIRCGGRLRQAFLRLNDFWLRHRLPASWAQMNLLVFQKGNREVSRAGSGL